MCDIGQRKEDFEFYKFLTTGDLDLILFEKLIDQVKAFFPTIHFNGTEPLLYENLVNSIYYSSLNGLRSNLTTNGYLLSKFAESLVKSGLSKIYISAHGPSQIHNKITGVTNCFDVVYKGVLDLVKSKKTNKSKTPEIYIAYTISNYNYSYLDETVDIFKDFVDGFVFSHLNFIDTSRAREHNKSFGDLYEVSPSSIATTNPKEINESVLVDQIRDVKSKIKNAFFLPDINTIEEIKTYYKKPDVFIGKKRCFVPWTSLQILSNGDVIPGARCFHIVMGNIKDKTIIDIWNSTKYREFRNKLKEIGSTPACSRCCGIFGSKL